MSRAANSDYQFVSDDIDEILPEFITQYELTTNRTVQPSSPVRLLISWMASLFVEAYARINYSGNQNIPSRAEDENLDAIGELFFDDTRPGASPATVTMEFTISEAQSTSVLIPAGTRVSTSDGEPIFQTSEDVYVPIGETSVTVRAECEEDGTSGNGFAAGQINTLIDVDNVLYFDHCENIDDSDGGADVAEDDEYYDLMVASEDAYSCAGARGAYEYWAKSVSTGIADVIVNSPTPGVIAIHTLMDDGQIAGDEIKAAVLRTDDGRGNVLLSRRNATETLAWENFRKMLEEKTETTVKVVDAVKGGVVGYLNGIRAFIPASHLALGFVEDLSSFKGQTIPVRVITAEPENKRLVLSSRDILRERREAEKAERISNIQPGLVTEGTVQSLKPYGAFVSLGDGIDGLVHISQISAEKRLKTPDEVLSVGDKVKVKVTAIKDGRISLSMKALDETAAPKPVEEERVSIPKSEELTTSLGSLLKGIKL